MCLGMMFTASGMLTKQMSVQHPFGNAADEFRNAILNGSGRPGMGLGLVRAVQVGSGLRVDTSGCD